MKVILQQDVKGQGKRGQMVNVSDGYARNFLFPKNLAVPAKADNMNKMKMQGLRIYLTGDNLWYKSARKGLDVRQSFSGSVGYGYSAIRTVSLGLNLTF